MSYFMSSLSPTCECLMHYSCDILLSSMNHVCFDESMATVLCDTDAVTRGASENF